ncbi:chymotrypsin-like protease CTRL-1 [Drosophila ficusphila]|uniref:chymotrypsin-like protease CTRL-1 n=1 Tax=Drosophila ficusphila TaxID=30025 RepID=UPI0007E695E2|nr:chymotrypsin-like protease CTRL-1 [Drosophila ficusphila]
MTCGAMKAVLAAIAVIGFFSFQVPGCQAQLLEQNCTGVPKISFRIVDGTTAKLGKYPWMALVSTKTHFICAGSLISHWFVLTAAHCFEHDPLTYVVRLGEHDRDSPVDCWNDRCQNYEEYNVDMSFQHKYYNKINQVFDIGLLRLARKVEFHAHIQPICIFTSSQMKSTVDGMTWFMAAGWGRTSGEEGSLTSRVLQELKINRRPKEDCIREFAQNLTPEQICVGNTNSNLCNGDSGGPQFRQLVYEDKVRYFQLGIASYTKEGCKDVSILTDVVSYGEWIQDVVQAYTPWEQRRNWFIWDKCSK